LLTADLVHPSSCFEYLRRKKNKKYFMLTLRERIGSLARLGQIFRQAAGEKPGEEDHALYDVLSKAIIRAAEENLWFTEPFIRSALHALARMLDEEKLRQWTGPYRLPDEPEHPRTVGVIMAGNIPLVGFHDMLCVLISGHRLLGHLSSKDRILPVAVRDLLTALHPGWKEKIQLTGEHLENMDTVIATGSNNTSRYFEYYFGKYPHIIRKNRNSAAFLTGKETPEELGLLADDVFLYFGLGCRNVSLLFVPKGYDFAPLLHTFSEKYGNLALHKKFTNNYRYHRGIFLMERIPHTDAGFFLLREDPAPASPAAVLHYHTYSHPQEVEEYLYVIRNEIQCRVGNLPGWQAFGSTQQPEPWDYADGIDTLKFLQFAE